MNDQRERSPSGRRHSKRGKFRDQEPSLSELLHLREYWKTIRKRLWTFINFFVILVIAVAAFTATQERVYEANVSLQIDAVTPSYTRLQDVNALGTGHYLSDQEYYATQHTRLRSRSQALAVLEKLDLSADSRFEDHPNPAGLALKMVRVEPKDKTRIVVVRCRHTSPGFAEQLCQQWADTFTARNIDGISTQMSDAIQRLADQVYNAKVDVDEAEAKLQAFKKQYNVLSLESKDRENILTQEITELTKAYSQAQAERLRRETEYTKLKELLRRENNPLALSLMVNNSLLQGLREKLSERMRERSELEQTYGAKHPKMIEVTSKISNLEKQIMGEVGHELGRAKQEFGIASANEGRLADKLSGRTAAALDLGEQGGEYTRLQREVETRRDLWQHLSRSVNETDVIQHLQVNNVQIVDRAMVGKDPVTPNVALNITLAVIVGILGGVSLALFFEYMDNSIKTREEVEALGMPFLGIIPSVTGTDGRPLESQRERYLYSMKNPKSAFAEFMRNIRTNILYMRPEGSERAQRLLVTSAGPREGKTTTSVNLGITMASGNRRVLLIDADLRRPSLHKAFGLGNERGFSDLLTGRWSAETIPMMTGQKGLFVIPSGPRPPNPAELLSGERVENVLAKLEQLFDVIIFDSPPVAAVTDAVVLSQNVDGVVLVVKSFKVGRDLVLQAKRQLEDVNANLYGVALNDFDIQRKSYGYYYYYTYYGQGDEPGPSKSRFGGRKKVG